MTTIHGRIGFGQRCEEHIVECDQRYTLYQIVLLKLPNLFRAQCAQSTTFIMCAPMPYLTL